METLCNPYSILCSNNKKFRDLSPEIERIVVSVQICYFSKHIQQIMYKIDQKILRFTNIQHNLRTLCLLSTCLMPNEVQPRKSREPFVCLFQTDIDNLFLWSSSHISLNWKYEILEYYYRPYGTNEGCLSTGGGGIPACLAGGIPACLAGLQGGVSQHVLQVSRPKPKGQLEGSGWGGVLQAHAWGVVSRPTLGGSPGPHLRGSPGPTPGGSPGPHPGGLQAHNWGDLQAHTQGGIPACTEADTPLADGYCCGWYASYWNAFLFSTNYFYGTTVAFWFAQFSPLPQGANTHIFFISVRPNHRRVEENRGAHQNATETKYKIFRNGRIWDNQVNPQLDLTMKISHQIWYEWCRAHCLFYTLFSYSRLELLKPLSRQR